MKDMKVCCGEADARLKRMSQDAMWKTSGLDAAMQKGPNAKQWLEVKAKNAREGKSEQKCNVLALQLAGGESMEDRIAYEMEKVITKDTNEKAKEWFYEGELEVMMGEKQAQTFI